MTESPLLPLGVLQRLWPHGDQRVPGLVAGIVAAAPDVFAKYNIATPALVAVMFGQFSEECNAGKGMEEDLSYSAQRLIEVWPKHFNADNAALYAGNPRALGNFIYEPPQHTDLGNRPGTDDGYDYRGRGLSQVTGRNGYAKLGQAVGLDLLNNPALVNDPSCALECAVADFMLCGCLPPAQADPPDIVGVTKQLNGGTNGLADRQQWTATWQQALGTGIGAAAPAPAQPTPEPALQLAPDAAPPSDVPTHDQQQGGGG